MLHEPPIVFLDEPTGGVDPVSRREFWRLIDDLSRQGTTVLVTTHYLDEAERCDRVAIIHAGRLAALGTTRELKRTFDDRPILEIRARESRRHDARARRDARGREDEPLRHGRARRAANAETRRRHGSRRSAARGDGLAGHGIEPVVPSLEDVFLESSIASTRRRARHEIARWRSPSRRCGRSGATAGRSLILLFVPAFFLFLYGYALNFDIRHVALAVQDRDQSAESRALVAASSTRRTSTSSTSRPSDADVDALMDRGPRARGARHSGGLLRATLRARRDGRRAGDPQRRQRQHGDDRARLRARSCCSEAASRCGGGRARRALVGVEPRVWYNPELRSTLFLVPGLIAYIAMITAVVSTALSIVREKERGTMEQVRMAPISTPAFIIGKTLPYLRALAGRRRCSSSCASMVLFDLPMRGSWLALSVVARAVSGRRARHGPARVDGRRHPAGGVSGGDARSRSCRRSCCPASSFRSRACRSALQYITLVVPARYFLVALRGIVLKGLGAGRRLAAARWRWPSTPLLDARACRVA